MVQRFKDTGHPVFRNASALSRGILKRLKGKETIHFNADASNTEFSFRIIHAANQLCISEQFRSQSKREKESTSETSTEREELVDREAFETVHKEILKSMNLQEVNSLVSTPRNQPTSGNGL